MILKRDWWGCEFVIENDEDRDIINNLLDSITDKSESYEEGEVFVSDNSLIIER